MLLFFPSPLGSSLKLKITFFYFCWFVFMLYCFKFLFYIQINFLYHLDLFLEVVCIWNVFNIWIGAFVDHWIYLPNFSLEIHIFPLYSFDLFFMVFFHFLIKVFHVNSWFFLLFYIVFPSRHGQKFLISYFLLFFCKKTITNFFT